ncbi:flippase [Halorubrum sp. CGM4_25_10-8A]|uniref:flippase n=1 Tax=Halorubrum sp. CGM4_25_10-8A TaxID=2518116 RepID=UPI0010F57D74|nr:flippase [Halorubrum sp. CGM4_25_10-8A]
MPDDGFRGILKGAFVVGAGMVFSKAISLLAEVVVARELATAEFGSAIFAYTVLLTIGGIALVGIPEGFTYYLSILDDRGDAGAAFRMVVSGISIITVILGIGVFSIYAIPVALIERAGISRAQWQWIELLAPLAIAYPVSQLSFGIMRGYDRSVPKVLSGDVLNKLIAFGAIGLAIWYNNNILIFLSFYLGQHLLSGVFAGGYAVYLLKTKLTRVMSLDRFSEDARQFFSYSWPLAFKNATRRLLGNTDIVLVGALLASSAVGYYRVGYVISQLGMVALVSITYLYTPRVARRHDNDDREGVVHLYRRATKWGTFLTFPLVLPMLYFSEQLIQFLFGAEYVAGAIVLTVLAVDVLFRVGMGPASATLQAIGRTRADFITTFLTMLINMVLSYLLISEFGILGAAIGTLASILFLNTVQVFLVYRYISILPYSLRYIVGALAIIVASLPLFLLVSTFVGDLMIPVADIPVAPPAFGLVFLIVEFVIVWFGGVLSQDEKTSISEMVRNNRIYFVGS